MQIEVEIFGQLSPGIQRCQKLTVERSMRVEEVADLLGLTLEEIGLIVIDGELREANEILSSGSRLCFFPPMSGG
jgi:molybdopterin converting factor small subunit